MPRICVFTGSSNGRRPGYRTAAVSMGQALVARGFGVDDPVSTGTSEPEKVLNRRVSLRVLIPPDPTTAGSRP